MINGPTDFLDSLKEENISGNESKIIKESQVQGVGGIKHEILNSDCEKILPMQDVEQLEPHQDLMSDDVSVVFDGTQSLTSEENIPRVNHCDNDLLEISLQNKCNIQSKSTLETDEGDYNPPLPVEESETAINNFGSFLESKSKSEAILTLDEKVLAYDTRQLIMENIYSDVSSRSKNHSNIMEKSSATSLHNSEESDDAAGNLIDVALTSNKNSVCNEDFRLLGFKGEQKSDASNMCGIPSDTTSVDTVTVVPDKKIVNETELVSSITNNLESDLNERTIKNTNKAMISVNLETTNSDENKIMSAENFVQTSTNLLSNDLTNKSSNATDSEVQKSSQDLKEKIGNSIKSMFDNNEHLNLLEKQNISNLQTNTLKKVNNIFSSIKSYNFPNFRANEETMPKDMSCLKSKQMALSDSLPSDLNSVTQSNDLNTKSPHVSNENRMLFSKLNKADKSNDHLTIQNFNIDVDSESQLKTTDQRETILEKTSGPIILDSQRNGMDLRVSDLPNSYIVNSKLIDTVKNSMHEIQEKFILENNAHKINLLDFDEKNSHVQKKSMSLDSSPVKHNRYHNVHDELYLLKETNIRLLAEISKLEEENNRVRKEFRTYREEADLFKSSMNEQLVQHEVWKEQSRLMQESEARAHAQNKKDLEVKMERLRKEFEHANKEKEASVMRYVTKESELITARKEIELVEKKCKELMKEKENVLGKLKVLSVDKARLTQMFDDKCTEYNILQRSLDKVTDEVTGKDIKLKWVQSKLDNEVENSRILADKLATVESQHAVQVDEQNRLKYSEDSQRLLLQEIDVLKKKSQALTEENNALSLKVQRLELERLGSDEVLSKCKAQVNSQNEIITQLRNQLTNMEDLKNQLQIEHERVIAKDAEVEQVQKSNTDLSQDMATCRTREAELLQFTEKLTAKNVRLQSEFSALEAKADSLEKDVAPLKARISQLESELREVKSELDVEKTCKEGDNKALARVVAERTKQLEAASKEIEELKSENQILKRKHITTVRELNKELSVLKRKAESPLTNGEAMCDTQTVGYGSRASSCQSLNEINAHHSPTSASIASTLSSTLQLEPDRNIIIERLVELQRSHARVIEKAEFLEEHNAQLVSELQRKTRILQNYILREQSGALTSRTMDVNKAEVSKHGGIMASLYSSKPVDGGMTLELSLEINRKLQAVLEDTILKNITLKENIDTLGEHIEKLSKKS